MRTRGEQRASGRERASVQLRADVRDERCVCMCVPWVGLRTLVRHEVRQLQLPQQSRQLRVAHRL